MFQTRGWHGGWVCAGEEAGGKVVVKEEVASSASCPGSKPSSFPLISFISLEN